MRIPNQSASVERISGTAVFVPERGLLPQLRVGRGLDDGPSCYFGCRANGGDDLICRFFCGLRPFTIGGLFLAN